MSTNKHEFINNSLPLQFGVLKIKDNSNAQARDPQIVQHQSTFVISNSVDHLGIHNNPESFRGCRKGMFRKPNSTTNAFSYGFSTNP
jgi:hypothetical protein